MASGDTFLANVEEGLDTMVSAARTRRQFPTDVMSRVCDRQTLPEGTGTAFREFLVENLTAQNYGETDDIDNPQQLDASIETWTPQLVAISTFIGKRVQARLDRKAFATFGELAQEAIQRKKNVDGHALFASATTTLCGTGTTLTSGHISAAVRRITSDATEPGAPPIAAVLHGYGIHDIQTEFTGIVGSYPVPEGMTAEAFRHGFQGMIMGANVYEDGLIALTSTPDARGGVFAKRGCLLVQGLSPWKETENKPLKGYGGTVVVLKDEYVWGERSAGNWLYGILHDATAPTS